MLCPGSGTPHRQMRTLDSRLPGPQLTDGTGVWGAAPEHLSFEEPSQVLPACSQVFPRGSRRKRRLFCWLNILCLFFQTKVS